LPAWVPPRVRAGELSRAKCREQAWRRRCSCSSRPERSVHSRAAPPSRATSRSSRASHSRRSPVRAARSRRRARATWVRRARLAASMARRNSSASPADCRRAASARDASSSAALSRARRSSNSACPPIRTFQKPNPRITPQYPTHAPNAHPASSFCPPHPHLYVLSTPSTSLQPGIATMIYLHTQQSFKPLPSDLGRV
jgi:hypothetical protein